MVFRTHQSFAPRNNNMYSFGLLVQYLHSWDTWERMALDAHSFPAKLGPRNVKNYVRGAVWVGGRSRSDRGPNSESGLRKVEKNTRKTLEFTHLCNLRTSYPTVDGELIGGSRVLM
jgi:hypothetical protein